MEFREEGQDLYALECNSQRQQQQDKTNKKVLI